MLASEAGEQLGDDQVDAQRFETLEQRAARAGYDPVSYTHLTLPTSDLV